MVAEQKNKPFIAFIVELPFLIIVAFLLAWAAKSFVVQPFFIPSGSMEPTLYSHDQILVNKLSYRYGKPAFGDIVVFKYPLDPKKDFIKRVMAVEGQEIEVKEGQVFINDKAIREDYVAKTNDTSNYGPIKIPKGKIFVMGDNRASSFDSRMFGLIPLENVEGKAFFVYWPFERMHSLKDI